MELEKMIAICNDGEGLKEKENTHEEKRIDKWETKVERRYEWVTTKSVCENWESRARS